jgi:hypothetical protein
MAGSWYESSGGGGGGSYTPTYDTYATIAALTPAVGDTAQATDGPGYHFVCYSAGVWTVDYRGMVVTPPPSTGWSWINQGGATLTTVGGAQKLTAPLEAYAASRFRGVKRARPSDPTTTPYFVEMALLISAQSDNGSKESAAAGFTDGTGIAYLACSSVRHHFTRNSAPATYAAQDFVNNDYHWPAGLFRARFEEDATLRHAKIWDGAGEYIELGTGYGRTVTFTADQVGFFCASIATNMAASVTLIHYDEGAL